MVWSWSAATNTAVYIKPDAQLTIYETFGVVPCKVAFRKNWQRDYNSAHRSASQQVKQRDIDRIKTDLGAECTTFFANALSDEPAYDVVEEWQQGEDVLLVFPNIVNLDIASPDLNSPSMSRSYSASAGSMTLYLELIDAETSEVLCEPTTARPTPRPLSVPNRITNRQAADRILSGWNTTQSGDRSNLRAPAEARWHDDKPARHIHAQVFERVKWVLQVALGLTIVVAPFGCCRDGRPFRPVPAAPLNA